MNEIIALIMIGIGLSMDAFSVSLSIGSFLNTMKTGLLISISVGLMHFFMPIIGSLIGKNILENININSSTILGIILIIIALEMVLDMLKKDTKMFNINYLTIIIFSITVSLDSFTTGIGLHAITDNIILSGIIFSINAFIFTISGLFLGKIGSKYLGTYANVLGIIILLITGINHIIE